MAAKKKAVSRKPPRLDPQPEGTNLGTVSKAALGKAAPTKGAPKVKAVLFIPEGASIEDNLNIQVVGIEAAGIKAIAARRC